MTYYVRRNAQRQIEAVSQGVRPGYTEQVPDNDPELFRFMNNIPAIHSAESHSALIERRVRALNRKGAVDARLAAIALRLGD